MPTRELHIQATLQDSQKLDLVFQMCVCRHQNLKMCRSDGFNTRSLGMLDNLSTGTFSTSDIQPMIHTYGGCLPVLIQNIQIREPPRHIDTNTTIEVIKMARYDEETILQFLSVSKFFVISNIGIDIVAHIIIAECIGMYSSDFSTILNRLTCCGE